MPTQRIPAYALFVLVACAAMAAMPPAAATPPTALPYEVSCKGALAIGAPLPNVSSAPDCSASALVACKGKAGCAYVFYCQAAATLGEVGCSVSGEVGAKAFSATGPTCRQGAACSAEARVEVGRGRWPAEWACQAHSPSVAVRHSMTCGVDVAPPLPPPPPPALPQSQQCAVLATSLVGPVNMQACGGQYACSDPGGTCHLEVTCEVEGIGAPDCDITARALTPSGWAPSPTTPVDNGCPVVEAFGQCSKTVAVSIASGTQLAYGCTGAGTAAVLLTVLCTLDAAAPARVPLQSMVCLGSIYTAIPPGASLANIQNHSIGLNPPCRNVFRPDCGGAATCTYNLTCEVHAGVGNVGCLFAVPAPFTTTWTDCMGTVSPDVPAQTGCRREGTLTVPHGFLTAYACTPTAVFAALVSTTCMLYA